MSDQREPQPSPDGTDHARAGADPMHPHPQDDESPPATDDDSPAERYPDSPGAAAAREQLDDGEEVPEPNEPG